VVTRRARQPFDPEVQLREHPRFVHARSPSTPRAAPIPAPSAATDSLSSGYRTNRVRMSGCRTSAGARRLCLKMAFLSRILRQAGGFWGRSAGIPLKGASWNRSA
jgi:hypothetical protein